MPAFVPIGTRVLGLPVYSSRSEVRPLEVHAMRLRTSWFYYAICVLGLPALLWAHRDQARLAALPEGFPPAGFLYPLRWTVEPAPPPGSATAVPIPEIEGAPGSRGAPPGPTAVAGSRAELRFLTETLGPGAAVTVVAPDGRSATAPLAQSLSFTGRLVTLISGLFFWAVSAFVFAGRAHAGAVRDFFWCTFLYGLAIMNGGVHFPAAGGWPVAARGILQFACLAALPPLFVHLTLNFPRRHVLLDRARGLMPALALLAGLLVLWQGLAFLRYARLPSPDGFRALTRPQQIADALLTLQVVAGFVILFTGMRRLELTRERAAVKWLLWGFAVGVTPYVFLRTLPELAGLRPPFSAGFDRLLELSIPIAFVFAVVRYQFLDIDIIIRRSLIYASLALLMTALYVAFLVAVGRSVEGLPRDSTLGPAIAIGAGAGLMFQPLRRAIGRAVDRTFFKLTHGYGQALAGLRARLSAVPEQAALLRTMDDFAAETLRPLRHGAVIEEQGAWLSCGDLPPEAWQAAGGARDRIPPGTCAAPNSTSLPEIESGGFPEAWSRSGVVLAEPVLVAGSPAGYLLLGRKQSERRYVEPDIDLVRAAAAEAGRALDRIRLVQRATAEAGARRRAEEIDRLKSDFLSRVAHDLRTPLASIAWSTDNLLDGVTGAPSESQAEYLRSIRASAGHLNRLVDNLLEISRLEQGSTRCELGPVDPHEVLSRALLTLRPLAEEQRVTLAVDPGPPAPVLGHAERLLEVLLNLIDNAIKFSPPGEAVEITIAPPAAGRRTISVRDRGPGLGAGDPARLFERFSQGGESPHARQRGFGLGLYIAKSYVELMRGEITAANHPQGGALFTCSLRTCAVEGEPDEGDDPDRG